MQRHGRWEFVGRTANDVVTLVWRSQNGVMSAVAVRQEMPAASPVERKGDAV